MALLVAGVAMLIVAPFAWGKGDHAGLPAWMPSLAGVGFAAPAALLGFAVLREVVRRTRTGFSVLTPQLIIGAFAMAFAVFMVMALATRLADSSVYDSLLNQDGSPNTSPGGFLFICLFASAFVAGGVAFASYIYVQAISIELPSRFDRRAGDADPMGEMLRGRSGKPPS
jgi:hypothetical protein